MIFYCIKIIHFTRVFVSIIELKFICSYIDEKSLRNTENKRVINPDDKLKNLLDPEEDTVLTYFNIQRFMNKHFIKKTSDENSK